MNASDSLEIRNRSPFEPLEIYMNDGSLIQVEEPFQIATRRNSPSCVVYDDDDRMHFLAYRNISPISTKAPPA